MIWTYIAIYLVIMIAVFAAKMNYYYNYRRTQEFEDDVKSSLLYSIFWPIGFLSTVIYKFFVWMR